MRIPSDAVYFNNFSKMGIPHKERVILFFPARRTGVEGVHSKEKQAQSLKIPKILSSEHLSLLQMNWRGYRLTGFFVRMCSDLWGIVNTMTEVKTRFKRIRISPTQSTCNHSTTIRTSSKSFFFLLVPKNHFRQIAVAFKRIQIENMSA